MRRVVSVWFPHWPTDRLRRRIALPAETPLVTGWHDGRRRIVAAADPAAAALGLRAGMAIAQALAIVPGLDVIDAEPDADQQALARLARWCHRTTPLVSIDGSEGIWLDITGCAHLAGSEAALLESLVARFARDGLHAWAAAADTPGAAHALARHDNPACIAIAPPGAHAAAIAPLPVGALRLPPEQEATLRRLGFERIQHLDRIPRALLARRFGPLPGLRLDQAHGRVHEPLSPLMPETVLQRRAAFLEPLLTADSLAIAVGHLVVLLCEEMERTGLGARQIDLLFERVDSHVAAIRIGTARPSRDAPHLVRMLAERLDTIDPGLGVEAMQALVPLAEPLHWHQQAGAHAPQDVIRLVDRLTNRLGPDRVFQATPLESEWPERAVGPAIAEGADAGPGLVGADPAPPPIQPSAPRPVKPRLSLVSSLPRTSPTDRPESRLSLVEPALVQPDPPQLGWKPAWAHRRSLVPRSTSWPSRLHAPARLLDPPRPVEALAALPDQPPVAFTWRRHRHHVRRADGPERVQAEWWRNDTPLGVRDYFQVEDDAGQRFWLFRQGNGLDLRTGNLSWFLHGLF